MRNLKKVLALVLAMAMSLSLAVTAGAAFNDQDKIVNTEAVDMCSALGIINGYTDGSFKPEGNVTRAEAAKMICIALNGGKEPVLSASATPVFADIAGHWAAKYIEYCNSLGIVAGKSATQFDPNGNVTGVELAKMLLIAIGYSADAEKFVGANWDTNVNVIASQKDLYEKLESIDPSVAATRDVAAQMVWNALNITMVEYDYKLSTVNGTLTSELVVKDVTPADGKDTLLEKKFDTQDTEDTTGILVKAQYIDKDEEYKYWLDDEESAPYVTEANYVDLLGQKVTFVVKADKDDTVYGAFSNSVVVASDLVGNYEECEDDDDCAKISDVDYDLNEDGVAVVVADAENHVASYEDLGDNDVVEPFYTANAIDVDDDGDIDTVMIIGVTFADVTYVGKDYINTTVGKLKAEDYSIYEGAEKDDTVIVSADMSLVTLGTVTELEKQTGKVESRSGDTVTIGGTAYDYTTVAVDAEKEELPVDVVKAVMNKDVEFYAYNGYLLSVETTSTVDIADYAVVTKIANAAGLTAPQAELLYTDGTKAVVDLVAGDYSDVADDKATEADEAFTWVGQLVTFEEDDGEFELTPVTELSEEDFDEVDVATGENVDSWIGADSAADANAKITYVEGKAKFAADAVIFVYDTEEEEYVVKTGADVAKITGDATIVVAGAEKNDNRALTTTFAYIETAGASDSDAVYGYVVSDVTYSENADKDEFETVTIWDGAKEVELTTAANKSFGKDIAKGTLISYTVDADGAVTDCDIIATDASGVALTAIDGDVVTIEGEEYEIDEDTVILYVDATETAGEEGGSIAVATEAEKVIKDEAGKDQTVLYYVANVVFDADDDNVLKVLVVDVDNDWNGDLD